MSYHTHYEPESDERWRCRVDPCLLHDVAPRPSATPGPRSPVVPEAGLLLLADGVAVAALDGYPRAEVEALAGTYLHARLSAMERARVRA